MTSIDNHLHVTLLMVMSANGVVARKQIEDSFEWNSEADRSHFLKRVNEIGTAIMGANTYRSIGGKPYEGIRFFVLTNCAEQFSPHPSVIFVSGDIKAICRQFAEDGIKRIALLGGPTVNRLFLENGLVDDIYLTIEPVLLPGDLQMVTGLSSQIPMQLVEFNPINDQKTLLLHYRVPKEHG